MNRLAIREKMPGRNVWQFFSQRRTELNHLARFKQGRRQGCAAGRQRTHLEVEHVVEQATVLKMGQVTCENVWI